MLLSEQYENEKVKVLDWKH